MVAIFWDYVLDFLIWQVLESEHVVGLMEVFPQGLGFVLVFEYMLTDLGDMIANVESPLNERHIKSYTLMLLR